MHRHRAKAVGLLLPILLGVVGPACAGVPAKKPRLVLLLAIDQLRPDRLSPDQPGGLGRLQREGRVFSEAALPHAFTETCPGHATMLTGRHPAKLGISGNWYIDPETLEQLYCVADSSEDAALLRRPSTPAEGRSPRNMAADTLGDWMKAQRPGTRSFSVSAKDRAAITMGGKRPDGVYWLDRAMPQMTTSGYYRATLPAWVAAWGPGRVLRGLPDYWEYEATALALQTESSDRARAAGRPARLDDYAVESPLFSRTSPHFLRRGSEAVEPALLDLQLAGKRLFASPFLDAMTLDFALELVDREELGRGPETDLLAVGLSATDIVGHLYGPEGWESRDALVRLDRQVGSFLSALEERLGKGSLLVVLTADHGVLPIPEWLLLRGDSECSLPGGRADPNELVQQLSEVLDRRFGPSPQGFGTPWLKRAGSRLTLNQARVAEQEVSGAAVLAAAEAHLEGRPGILRVWTREEVAAGKGSFEADLYANSWDPVRGGDLALQTERDCLFTTHPNGTGHGSPWEYDRAVPLVFFGTGVSPGRVSGAAAPVDIATTLAAALGIDMPPDLDGRVLPLR